MNDLSIARSHDIYIIGSTRLKHHKESHAENTTLSGPSIDIKIYSNGGSETTMTQLSPLTTRLAGLLDIL